MTDQELIDATERWFLRRGIPHFIHRYRASEDVFTRAVPALVVVAVAEVTLAARTDWRWWQNLLGLVGALALLIGAWGLVNRARGRRWSALPRSVGPVELVAFVLLPPFVPASISGQWGQAVAGAAANLVLLGLIYLVTSYGLVPMTRWALGQTVQQISAVAGLLGRALPLLLLFSVALFINAEVWQVAGSLDTVLFAVTCGFFVAIGTGFLLLRLPSELARLRTAVTGEALVRDCAETPLARAAVELAEEGEPEPVPLSRRQEGNVLLVLLFSQAVQVLLVSLAMSAFFFAFGLIAIRPETAIAWLGEGIDPGEWFTWTVAGRELVVTRALVQVAALLGVFSGFYFTVYVITDSTYREEFFTEVVQEVRESLAVRTVYLALLGRVSSPSG